MSFGVWCIPLRPRPATEYVAGERAGWLLDDSKRGIKLFDSMEAAVSAAVRERSGGHVGPWTFEAKEVSPDARWDDERPR